MASKRYFLELMYRGAGFSGFQVQENAPSVQEELEKALQILQKEKITLTGSSRTDTGVHAWQNFFHFDYEGVLHPQLIYKLNAIISPEIAVRGLFEVHPQAHCRFDAISRTYQYHIYQSKNPFLRDRSYYYPFPLDLEQLQAAAGLVREFEDFSAFSKRNSQVKTFRCRIMASIWEKTSDGLVYRVQANRFLRGMVRGLTGTMLQVGRGKISLGDFRQIIMDGNPLKTDFAVPGHGLFLVNVEYPSGLLQHPWEGIKNAGNEITGTE
jgi:tRNA pseudouridine38-40 synthase